MSEGRIGGHGASGGRRARAFALARAMTLAAVIATVIAPTAARAASDGDYADGNGPAGEKVPMTAAPWAKATAATAGPARAIGSYAAGCLGGGVALPSDGPGYQAIRLGRRRNFGHPALIDYLRDLGARVERAGLGVMMVADMGQPRGGPMPNGHASHQMGLDADIWLRLDTGRIGAAARETPSAIQYVDYGTLTIKRPEWTASQVALIRLAATDDRVARIFANPVIKGALCDSATPDDRAWLRKVRPWWGHDAHIHVRLSCPADSPGCVDQDSPGPGDGCGAEVESWLDEMRKPKKPSTPKPEKPRVVALPRACLAVVDGPS